MKLFFMFLRVSMISLVEDPLVAFLNEEYKDYTKRKEGIRPTL